MIHDSELEAAGGLAGIKDPGYLELIIDKPFTEYFGEEQYPGLFFKAAVYMHGLATAHCFFDANKRTALLTALTFLDLNGFEVNAPWEDLFEVTIRVATKEMDVWELAEWLKLNSVATN